MKIFNTLSGQKEDFHPQKEVVTMYVCGITTYDECHIGHAMSYIVFDVIKRYLKFKGYKVKHVQNFTDIDDKVIERARQLGISPSEVSHKYIDHYFVDMDALNIERADFYPKATEEIPQIIEVIRGLLVKGNAYESEGSVYFRVRSFPGYGKLSHRNLAEMISKESIYMEKKEYPLDFALWKAAKPGEPFWESPWGRGRPGWHIECSAIALKYLGASIDIHGGGQDLIFPHHENEIAQSETFTGEFPFVQYWIHNGLMQRDKQKMSKSIGNLVRVEDMLNRFSADAVRFFVLSSHYRSPLVYSEEALNAIERGTERLRLALSQKGGGGEGATLNPKPFERKFVEAMDDDFNTAQAIAVLYELAKEINQGATEEVNIIEAQGTLLKLAGVLGLTLEEKRKPPLDAEALINLLVSVRDNLRQAQQWQLADKIRRGLAELGITLEDAPQGTIWKHKR
ncbi:MAG: cysteine--tRNA ligase [Dehalococcoidia bacterium CG2_30_46_19]|nr:MAG: cysteine--tRNA ligase [Dehalococcoidia bacterium CG2_30_46_19]